MITLLPPAVNDCQRTLTFVRSERGTTILGPNDGEDWASHHQVKGWSETLKGRGEWSRMNRRKLAL
jgi:hypothetical protein